jgi:hypothetical protein
MESNYNNDKLIFVSDHLLKKFLSSYWCALIDDSFEKILYNSNIMSFNSLDAMKEEFSTKKEHIEDKHFSKKYEMLESWTQMLMLDEIRKIMISHWKKTRVREKKLKKYYKKMKEISNDYEDFQNMERATEECEVKTSQFNFS